MNIVKILLVLGLGYVALTQKSEKTKNMLLVVTGLLAFCMFSVEGFSTINFGSTNLIAVNDVVTIPPTGNTITGSDSIIYTFTPGEFNITTNTPDYDCPENNVKADNRESVATSDPLNAANINDIFSCVDKQLCSEADASLTCSSGTKKTGDSDYCAGSTCVAEDFSGDAPACCELPAPNELCTEGKTRLNKTCPDYYTPKENARCRGATCVAADFNTTTKQCCNPVCSDSKCSFWEWLFRGDGDPCGYFSKCED